MLFKALRYFFSGALAIEYNEQQFCEIIFEVWSVVKEEMLFKRVLI